MAGSTTGPLHQGRFGYYDQARHWHDAVPLAPEEERVLPETVPHSWLASHRVGCGCAPCARFPDLAQLGRIKQATAQLRSAPPRRG